MSSAPKALLTWRARATCAQFHAILAPGTAGEGPLARSAERWAALEAAMEAVVARGVASFKMFMVRSRSGY